MAGGNFLESLFGLDDQSRVQEAAKYATKELQRKESQTYTDPFGNVSRPHEDNPENQFTRTTGGRTTGGASANVGGSAQGYLQGQQSLAARAAGYAGQEAQQYGQAQATRNSQLAALGLMQQAAQGSAPSVAAIQQQQGLQSAMLAQQALASGARGPAGLAMAGYNAAANTAALQQQGIGQAAALRAQEMAAARGQYGEYASGLRGQDLAAMQAQAGLGSQYTQFGLSREQAQQQAQAEAARQTLQEQMGYAGLQQQESAANKQLAGQVISGGLGAISKGIAAGAA